MPRKKVDEIEIVEEQSEETSLQVVEKPDALMPIHSGADMVQAFDAYLDLQKQLDKRMPEAIQMIKGNAFRKKQYWRALSRAFGLSVEVRSEERIVTEDGDWGYTVVYRAEAPNGKFTDGDGCCMASEKFGGGDTVHNVRSHANTRAFNRAVSNLVGFGEVSADEMPDGSGVSIGDERMVVSTTQPKPKKAIKKKASTPKPKPKPKATVDSLQEPEYVEKVEFKRDLGNDKSLYHFYTNYRKYTCIDNDVTAMVESALEKECPVEMIYEEKKTKKVPGKAQGSYNALSACNHMQLSTPTADVESIADDVEVDADVITEVTAEDIPF
jgi:hypothetical protein